MIHTIRLRKKPFFERTMVTSGGSTRHTAGLQRRRQRAGRAAQDIRREFKRLLRTTGEPVCMGTTAEENVSDSAPSPAIPPSWDRR